MSFLFFKDQQQNGFDNIKTIAYIKKIPVTGQINLLENEGGLSVYLGKNFEWIHIDEKHKPFETFVENKNIGLVVISENLIIDELKKDSSWYDFLNFP